MNKHPDAVARSKLLKVKRVLEGAGKLIWLLGAMLFALGIYSAFWHSVPGEVLEQRKLYATAGGYTTPRAARAETVAFPMTHYAYAYKGHAYTSRLICWCIPVGLLKEVSAGDSVPVYVADALPSVSVLVPGPDYVTALFLFIVGAAPWGIALYIRRLLAQQVEAASRGE